MPTQPIRVFTTDVRERKYSNEIPGQFRERLNATDAATLRELPAGANWPADLVAAANTAAGGKPSLQDRVTLYRGSTTDTRTWNGRKWVAIEHFIDGQTILQGTLSSPTLAPRSLTTEILRADPQDPEAVISGEQYASGSLNAQKTGLRSFRADNFAGEQLLVDTLQIRANSVSFFNLDGDLLSLTSANLFEVPINQRASRPQSFALPTGQALASYRRNAASDVITLEISMRISLSVRGRRGAYSRVYYDIRAWVGTNASAATGTETILHTWSGNESVSPDRTGTGSESTRIFDPQSILVEESPDNGTTPLTISIAQSPVNTQRYLFFDANYFWERSTGQYRNRDDNRPNHDAGGPTTASVAISMVLNRQGND